MRDLVVREALEQLAADAALSLGELVSSGHEVPFEVEEQPGDGAALYHYTPLIDRFLREHVRTLRGLDGYGTARAAVEAAGFAQDYLRYVGGVIPSDPESQAGEAIFVFLCRLWRDCPTFELDDQRIEVAMRELENSYDGRADTVEVIAPLAGFAMPVEKIAVGKVTLVQADTVEAPAEALRIEGAGLPGWQKPVLAVTRVAVHGEGSPANTGLNELCGTITSLRLLGEGSVGLGPHAWARAGDGQWRRIATGMAPVRPGGYRLAENDCDELSLFAESLRMRPVRSGEMSFAVRRFEAGLERSNALDGLSDYLLALRSLLEGGGPADLGLALRVAALCAEPAERAGVKNLIDDAFALEREVMIEDCALENVDAAVLLVRDIEDLTRAILRDAVGGHLGLDLRATADEILLADGLSTTRSSEPSTPSGEAPDATPSPSVSEIPVDIRPGSRSPDGDVGDENDVVAPEAHMLRVPRPPRDTRNVPKGAGEDWFGGEDPGKTLEWPNLTRRDPRERKSGSGSRPSPGHADNVRNLFPEPETTEWSISGAPKRVVTVDVDPEEPAFRSEDEHWEAVAVPFQSSFDEVEDDPGDDDYWSAPV